ncbi:MAG: hypothetical protein U9R08_03580 [Nanoarchaeota archaeon]|nr:hypothetical protein [Nanoarchaeota archaeon]
MGFCLLNQMGWIETRVVYIPFNYDFLSNDDNVTGAMYSPNIKIIMRDRLADELRNQWNEHLDSEYAACIKGDFSHETDVDDWTKGNATIYLDKIESLHEGESNFVSIGKCNEMALIHNHPNGPCRDRIWMGDTEAAKWHFKNGVSLFLIQCSQDQIEIYTRDNMYNGRLVLLSQMEG